MREIELTPLVPHAGPPSQTLVLQVLHTPSASNIIMATERARQLLDAALARHPSDSKLGPKDFTRVRKFLDYVYEDVAEIDEKQRCLRAVSHEILPAVGVLLRSRDLSDSAVQTIREFCLQAPESIEPLGWRHTPQLWEACLEVLSSSDIYIGFRRSMSLWRDES
jgi:hypothetical protein